MNVDGTVAIVTGGGGGIGGALAGRLAAAGARVVCADLDSERARAVAAAIGDAAIGTAADVADESALRELIALAESTFGPVDVFCANAGVGVGEDIGSDDAEWELAIGVNVMAHVRAARLLVPGWIERGRGYFVSTASAAGLLTQIGSAPYAVTKHAAVGFAEWLSVTYGDRGVGVSCLCPMGVNTDLLNAGIDADAVSARTVAHAGRILEPEEVADRVLEAIADERFLVLPHPEVLDFYRYKGADYDRWIGGMRRLQRTVST